MEDDELSWQQTERGSLVHSGVGGLFRLAAPSRRVQSFTHAETVRLANKHLVNGPLCHNNR